MDYVDGRFLLVIKDENWTPEEIRLLKRGVQIHFGYTNGIVFFVAEGGDIDSSDFYFNIQECDEKQQLLAAASLQIELVLLNAANEVCFKKTFTCSKEQTETMLQVLKEQNETEFMPSEYDVNVEGMQSAYEPYEMLKFARCEWKG